MLGSSNQIFSRNNTVAQVAPYKNDNKSPLSLEIDVKSRLELSPFTGHHITDQVECASPTRDESPQNFGFTAVSPQMPASSGHRNVVIFGDSGVGKSSLINMLAGHQVAKTSSSAIGCTFQSSHYKIPIHGELYNVWDTAGLDEGTQGRVPAEVAEKHLTKLLRDLGGANGIHLLVYCLRGSGIKKSLARNYSIFYSAICRKKVPIVAVVTGLENEPLDMAQWWAKGEKELSRYKMRFDDHACVTTLGTDKTKGTVLEQRSIQSQAAVQNLVASNCRRAAARRADTSLLIKAAISDMRSMIKSGWESQGASNIIIMSTDVPVFRSDVMGHWERCSTRIRGKPFVFFRVSNTSGSGAILKSIKGRPDLLIFAGRSSSENVERFRWFYNTCRGEICPVIIVSDEPSTDGWDRQLFFLGIQANVVSLDSNSLSSRDLHTTIDELCLVRGAKKIRRGSIFKLFVRRTPQASPSDDMFSPPSPLIGRSSSFVREGGSPDTQGLARRPSGNLSQHDGTGC